MALQRDKVVNNAEKLVAKGKIDSAIKEYQRLLDENPNDVNTLNRIGDLWVRIERIDEAAKVFRKIADHYAHDGFFLKAIAIYKKINKLDPSRLETYAKLAELYAKQGLAMEAKGQYMVLSDYYLKHGDSENALQIFRKIGELDPQSVTVHVKLADLCAATGNNSEALEQYDQVGRLLLKRGMAAEAVQIFSKALRLDSGNVDLAESLVSALIEERDYDHAVQIVNTALESNKANPRLIILLAKIYMAREQTDAARKVLEDGFTENPGDVQIREHLADLYLRQGKPDRALELTAPIINVALDRGEGSSALDLLNRILKVDPDHIGALEKRIEAYSRLHEKPNVLEATNRLAEAFIAKDDFPSAEKALRELIRLDPENLQSREKLLFVRKQIGGTFEDIDDQIQPAEDLIVDAEDYDFSSMTAAAPIEEAVKEEPETEPEEDTYDIELTPEPPPSGVDVGGGSSPAASAAGSSAPEMSRQDLEFVTDHLTEADVFAKYGLTDKAVDHLREALERAPKHLPAWEKLLAVYVDEGIAAHVSSTADQYITLLRDRGEWQLAENVAHDVVNRGYTLSATAAAPSPAPAPHPPATPATPQRIHQRSSAARPVEPVGVEHGFEVDIEDEIDLEEHLATISPEENLLPEPSGSGPTKIELDLDGPTARPAAPLPETADFALDDLLIGSPVATPGFSEKSAVASAHDQAGSQDKSLSEVPPSGQGIALSSPGYEFELDTLTIDDLPTLDDLPTIDDLPELLDSIEEHEEKVQAEPHGPQAADAWSFDESSESPMFSGQSADSEAEVMPSDIEAVAPPLIDDDSEPGSSVSGETIPSEAVSSLEDLDASSVAVSSPPSPEEEITVDDYDWISPPRANGDSAPDLIQRVDVEPSSEVATDGGDNSFMSIEPRETDVESSSIAAESSMASAEPILEQPTEAGHHGERFESVPAGESTEPVQEIALERDEELAEDSIPLPEEIIADELDIPEEDNGPQIFYGEEAVRQTGPDLTNSTPSPEDLGELDFYIEQELIEEARTKLQTLNARFPQHPELVLRTQQFDAIVPTSEVSANGDRSTTTPEAEELFMDSTVPSPAEPNEQPTAPFGEVAGDSGDIFAAEDNFFDLAQELENEIEENLQDTPSLSEEDQSLDQIFREFKKGVEQQLDTEDYETHYNLGIAYKEMGLIDEAIGEFQLASKDPARAIDGCSMLGLCFLEKGMPQLAIKWYRKAIEMPEISEEEHLGVLYDLALAYLETGDIENAHKNFLEVYGINSKYRDVASRIKELEDVKRAQ